MKKFYVVGNKASKSLSPMIFNHWFKKHNIKARYGYLELTEKNFHNKIKHVLEKKDTLGLNVTIPFKNKIIKHLGKIDTHAKKIGAVNCVTNKKTINGTNTDWTGYYKTLPIRISHPVKPAWLREIASPSECIYHLLYE